jgi:hypothetical protein
MSLASDVRALDEWRAGVPAAQLATKYAAPVLAALGEHLLKTHYTAYSNPKHPDHFAISSEVAELMQHGNPGFVGASGEVCKEQSPGGMFGGGA